MFNNMSYREWGILVIDIFIIVTILRDYLKRKEMGTVLLKSKSKKNFIMILLGIGFLMSICDIVYFLFQYKKDFVMVIDNSKSMFFSILVYHSLVNTNRITEKGIILSNTLFSWLDIETWSWSDNTSQNLMIDAWYERKYKKDRKILNVKWEVHPGQRESVDRILKEYIPEKSGNI